MEKQLENISSIQEKTHIEQLQEQLVILSEQYDNLQEHKSDYFDADLLELYNKVRGMMPEARSLYIKSVGEDVNNVLENYKKHEDFVGQLLFINGKKSAITREIRGINDKEEEDKREKEFNSEKDTLITSLYEALDAIHSQIPQEAKDVGMTTEIAIKQYLPQLERKATQIEYWIGEAEKSKRVSDLTFLKREMEWEG